MGQPARVVVQQAEFQRVAAPADFLQQLTPQRLLRPFPRLQMAAEQPPAAGGDDGGDVVAQLHQPVAVALQQGQGHLRRHGRSPSVPASWRLVATLL